MRACEMDRCRTNAHVSARGHARAACTGRYRLSRIYRRAVHEPQHRNVRATPRRHTHPFCGFYTPRTHSCYPRNEASPRSVLSRSSERQTARVRPSVHNVQARGWEEARRRLSREACAALSWRARGAGSCPTAADADRMARHCVHALLCRARSRYRMRGHARAHATRCGM